jgi:hypothetical protein
VFPVSRVTTQGHQVILGSQVIQVTPAFQGQTGCLEHQVGQVSRGTQVGQVSQVTQDLTVWLRLPVTAVGRVCQVFQELTQVHQVIPENLVSLGIAERTDSPETTEHRVSRGTLD